MDHLLCSAKMGCQKSKQRGFWQEYAAFFALCYLVAMPLFLVASLLLVVLPLLVVAMPLL